MIAESDNKPTTESLSTFGWIIGQISSLEMVCKSVVLKKNFQAQRNPLVSTLPFHIDVRLGRRKPGLSMRWLAPKLANGAFI